MCVMGGGWGMCRSWKKVIWLLIARTREDESVHWNYNEILPSPTYLLLQIPFLHHPPGPIEWSTIYFMDSPCPSTKPA